ncbi:MAG: hypothetical protein ACJ75A_23335, partial [Actinomycetes bacterium]
MRRIRLGGAAVAATRLVVRRSVAGAGAARRRPGAAVSPGVGFVPGAPCSMARPRVRREAERV